MYVYMIDTYNLDTCLCYVETIHIAVFKPLSRYDLIRSYVVKLMLKVMGPLIQLRRSPLKKPRIPDTEYIPAAVPRNVGDFGLPSSCCSMNLWFMPLPSPGRDEVCAAGRVGGAVLSTKAESMRCLSTNP